MPDIIILSIFSLIQSAVIHWLIKKWYKEKNKNSKKCYSVSQVEKFVIDQWRKDNEFYFKKLSDTLNKLADLAAQQGATKEDIVWMLKDLGEFAEAESAIHEFNSIAKTHVQTEEK